jgi:hypothetical protein
MVPLSLGLVHPQLISYSNCSRDNVPLRKILHKEQRQEFVFVRNFLLFSFMNFNNEPRFGTYHSTKSL